MPGPIEQYLNDQPSMEMYITDEWLAFAREQDAKLAKLEADNARLLAALESITPDLEECIESALLGEMQRAVMQTGVDLARAAIEEAKR